MEALHAAGRLARQLLTEVLVLFLMGGAGGMLIAILATRALERMTIPGTAPVSLELSPDLRVFVFALLLSLATGLLFGLPPALQASRIDLTTRLRNLSGAGGMRKTLMGRALIVGQLALSLVLLVSAGLFTRALARGGNVDPGFDVTGVVVAPMNTEAWGYDAARGRAFYRALRERVAALPGVSAVSSTGVVPLSASGYGDAIQVADAGNREARVFVQVTTVDPGYFTVVRIPLLRGRPLVETDGEGAPNVAVVNETLAKRSWPDGSAVGRTFGYRGERITIVGVARDAKYSTLSETTPPFVYFPMDQVWRSDQTMMVRTNSDLKLAAPAIQQAVLSIDPGLPRPRVTTLAQETSIVLLPQRVAAMVTGALGAVGLLLSTVGLYGLIAYSVSRRTREIGVRVALGASRSNVLGLILRDGMRLTGIGVVMGLVLAAGATRLIAGFLFSVSPLDAITFVGMSILFIAVALVACYLPARRAAASDPIAALRTE